MRGSGNVCRKLDSVGEQPRIIDPGVALRDRGEERQFAKNALQVLAAEGLKHNFRSQQSPGCA